MPTDRLPTPEEVAATLDGGWSTPEYAAIIRARDLAIAERVREAFALAVLSFTDTGAEEFPGATERIRALDLTTIIGDAT